MIQVDGAAVDPLQVRPLIREPPDVFGVRHDGLQVLQIGVTEPLAAVDLDLDIEGARKAEFLEALQQGDSNPPADARYRSSCPPGDGDHDVGPLLPWCGGLWPLAIRPVVAAKPQRL